MFSRLSAIEHFLTNMSDIKEETMSENLTANDKERIFKQRKTFLSSVSKNLPQKCYHMLEVDKTYLITGKRYENKKRITLELENQFCVTLPRHIWNPRGRDLFVYSEAFQVYRDIYLMYRGCDEILFCSY